MENKKQTFSGAEKAKMVLEALREQKTDSELAQEFEVDPDQVNTWMQEAEEHLSEHFTDKRRSASKQTAHDKLVAQLQRQISQLQTEVEWLKNKIDQVESNPSDSQNR